MKKGKTFIVSGPSGVGKGSVLKVLLEKRKDVYVSVSATTRQPRTGEENGVHYHFLDVDTFHEWMAQDAFWNMPNTWAIFTARLNASWTKPWRPGGT